MGDSSKEVKWILADASDFHPQEKYDFWHDRAAFHFLTDENEIDNYITTASQFINPEGYLVIGTFSEEGPLKCSGIEIRQYSEEKMNEHLGRFFRITDCITIDHKTPSGTIQNFNFFIFQKIRHGRMKP